MINRMLLSFDDPGGVEELFRVDDAVTSSASEEEIGSEDCPRRYGRSFTSTNIFLSRVVFTLLMKSLKNDTHDENNVIGMIATTPDKI